MISGAGPGSGFESRQVHVQTRLVQISTRNRRYHDNEFMEGGGVHSRGNLELGLELHLGLDLELHLDLDSKTLIIAESG